jgi:hypothetical protein
VIHGEACPRVDLDRMGSCTRSLWQSHVTSMSVTNLCVSATAGHELITGPAGAWPVARGKSNRAETSLVGVRYAAEG